MALLVDNRTEAGPSVDNLRTNRKAINKRFIVFIFHCTCLSEASAAWGGGIPLIRIKIEGHERMSFRSSTLGQQRPCPSCQEVRLLLIPEESLGFGFTREQMTVSTIWKDLLSDRIEIWTYGFWTLKAVFFFVFPYKQRMFPMEQRSSQHTE